MIKDALDFQRRQLDEHTDSHTRSLVRGTKSRDEDERVRGILRGLEIARQIVDDLENRLRKVNGEE